MSSDQTGHVRALDRTIVGGLAWTFGGKWATQIVTWASVLILARLLSPTDFGLLGMAGVYIAIANTLAEFGLAGAVMQMRELSDDVLAQLHTVALLTSTAACVICLMTSPLVAYFFNSPQLTDIVAVNSFVLFIVGFQLVPTGLLRRRLDYRRLATIEATQAIVRAGLCVLFAFLGMSYWSILAGGIIARILAVLMTIRAAPVHFLRPIWSQVKKPLIFGGQLSVQSLTNTISRESDSLIVGKILGENALGSYRMAYDLARVPSTKIAELLFRVTGPLFANVQNDEVLLRRYYTYITEMLTIGVIPIAIGFAVLAESFVNLFLGSKWEDVAGPLRWMCIYTIFEVLISLNHQVLLSLRKIRFTTRMALIRLFLMPLAFILGAKWGIEGIAICWVCSAPIVLGSYLYVVSSRINMTAVQVGSLMAPGCFGGTVMTVGIIILNRYCIHLELHDSIHIALIVLVGALVYSLVLILFYRSRLRKYYVFFCAMTSKAKTGPTAIA